MLSQDESNRLAGPVAPRSTSRRRAAKSFYAPLIVAIALSAVGSPALAQQTGPNTPSTSAPSVAQVATPRADTETSPFTWHGVTIYGAYDIGLGWVSHGLPENGYNYEGEGLINKNGNHSRFLAAQNNLSQTGLGIRAKEDFLPGWSLVFNGSTGINPQSGDLANMAHTNTINNGLPRSRYSYAGDGARAGQPFNDELFGGVSSTRYGTLTFGRQRALGTDAVLQYDPAGGAYAFSFIGYNGLAAGGGDTQDTRLNNAFKYRLTYGPAHFGLLYKLDDGRGGCYSASTTFTSASCSFVSTHNSAYGFDFGGVYRHLSVDVVVQHVNQAISVVNPLLGPTSPTQPYQSTTDSIDTNRIAGQNLIETVNTEYGIITDNTSAMIAAKYTFNQLKFYGAYEHIVQVNPSNPLGIGATAQGGYKLSGVEDDNLDSPKVVQVAWTGVRYAFDPRTDVTLSYYREWQNDFREPRTCSVAAGYRSSCAGSLDEVSIFADHHFRKWLDLYGGVSYSDVGGGLGIAIPHGPGVPYYHNTNVAPTLGARLTF